MVLHPVDSARIVHRHHRGGVVRAPRWPRTFLAAAAALLPLAPTAPALAVKMNARLMQPPSLGHGMSLPGKVQIRDPGTPDCQGLTTPLAAPAASAPPTSDSVTGCAYGSPTTPDQLTADAISSIHQPTAGVFDLSVTLTNVLLSTNAGMGPFSSQWMAGSPFVTPTIPFASCGPFAARNP